MKERGAARGSSLRIAGVIATGLTLLFSCGEEPRSRADATWYSPCVANEDCGSLECVCGLCMKPCATAESCNDLSAFSRCLPLESSSCAEPTSVCVASCTTTAECTDLNDGLECMDGQCVPEGDAGGTGGRTTDASAPPVGGSGGAAGTDAGEVVTGTGGATMPDTSDGTTTLAEGNPTDIALDATHLYWIESTAIWKVPLDGGPRVRLSTEAWDGGSIAVDATSVYWTSDRALRKVAIGGGAPLKLAQGGTWAGGVAVDATDVYFDDSGTVMKLPLAGGAAVPVVTNAALGVMDATGIYWTNSADGTVMRFAFGSGVADSLDAGVGGAVDGSLEAGSDGAVDGSLEAGFDATLDAGIDAANDAGVDASRGVTSSVILATAQSIPAAVAVDGTNVYWATKGPRNSGVGGAIMKAPIDGGAPVTLATGQFETTSIAVDGTSVYWTTGGCCGGMVMKVGLAGGTPIILASLQSSPVAIAVDDTGVYFGADGAIKKVPLDAGTPADPLPPPAPGDGSSAPTAMAIDSTHAYWLASEGAVMKAPLDGGTSVMLASGQPSPVGIAVDSTSVFWTNADNGTVMSVPLGGGSPVALALAQPAPGAISADASHVYWMTSAAVMKAPSGGGAPVEVASLSLCGTSHLVLGATNLYFLSHGALPDCTGATVMQVPLTGGEAMPVAAGQVTPVDIYAGFVVDAASVYWGMLDESTWTSAILKAPLAGGAPETLVSGLTYGPSAFAIDGANVYWTQATDASVPELMKMPLAGGTPVALAPLESQDLSTSIAVDATRVYWMRGGLVPTVMGVIK